MPDTPGQLPTVTAGTRIGIKLTAAEWCAVIAAIGSALTVFAGGCLWLYILWANVQDLKADNQAQRAELKEVRAALGSIQETLKDIELRQKYGIVGVLPTHPRSTP